LLHVTVSPTLIRRTWGWNSLPEPLLIETETETARAGANAKAIDATVRTTVDILLIAAKLYMSVQALSLPVRTVRATPARVLFFEQPRANPADAPKRGMEENDR
jgi:hypothetical protein